MARSKLQGPRCGPLRCVNGSLPCYFRPGRPLLRQLRRVCPYTQSKEENKSSREMAEEIADTFPICQPEGFESSRWFRATCDLPGGGAFAPREGGLPIGGI